MNNLFLALTLCLSLLMACKSDPYKNLPDFKYPVHIHFDPSLQPFYHGVASGDPLADRVIIWTRVTPEKEIPAIIVLWQIATDENFDQSVKSGYVETSPEMDYTVKVDVGGLRPGVTYYYRFSAFDTFSPVGRTKTLDPNGSDSLKFAVISCSNWQWGYFNVYAKIAERPLLDAVLHLGDYIYEYAIDGYGDTTLGRFHLPEHEIITLNDYRTRYSQYRTDPDLMAAHQMHPFITIWDDHEVANDNYTSGAQNHQPETEGPYEERMKAAMQAYYEWMPMRLPEDRFLYRSFSFGNLVDLFMLDGRLEGRDEQVKSVEDPRFENDDRTMLGEEQLEWLLTSLENSSAQWKLIGNQVIFSGLDMSPAFPQRPINLDSWDGYPAEQQKIMEFIKAKNIENVIILTGDTHCSWAFETVPDSDMKNYSKTGKGSIAVEIGTPSINSSNYDEYASMDTVNMALQGYLNPKVNPHLKFANLSDHGYVILTVAREFARSDWYFVETVKVPNLNERLAQTFSVYSGKPVLQK